MLGISIREHIGIGDKMQFSSLPENYYRATGDKLIDVSRSWIFDHNPFVDRQTVPTKVRELWNFPQVDDFTNPRAYASDPTVYLSNAEVTAARFKVPVILNRPRLYIHEQYPFKNREMILLHTIGVSHGPLPKEIIEHVVEKYKPTGCLFQIGLPSDPPVEGVARIPTPTIWDLVKLLSKARMLICPDSGPSWIAACYPDVVIKKVRQRKVHGQKEMRDWVPLEIGNIHSHWDDRLFQIFNPTKDDVGFMPSYRRI